MDGSGALGPCPATGKVRFVERADAKQALASLRKRGCGYGTLYRCRHCGSFHTSSQSPARKDAIAHIVKRRPPGPWT